MVLSLLADLGLIRSLQALAYRLEARQESIRHGMVVWCLYYVSSAKCQYATRTPYTKDGAQGVELFWGGKDA
jgi:hypothetical protein